MNPVIFALLGVLALLVGTLFFSALVAASRSPQPVGLMPDSPADLMAEPVTPALPSPAPVFAGVDLDGLTIDDVEGLPWDTGTPNAERALMALAAVSAHATECGNRSDNVRTVLGDLLTNLIHLCDATRLDFDELTSDAFGTYQQELYDRPGSGIILARS